MKELYYARHGITVDLENGIRNRPDSPLTTTGRQEARGTGLTLLRRNIMPGLIVSSELDRAVESAREIAGVIGYDPDAILSSALLNERECGIATGMKNRDIKQQYPDGFDVVPGAESTMALQERAALSATWLESFQDDVVLVVAHGVAGRAMARHYEGRPYTEEFDRGIRDRVNLANGQIMRLHPGPLEMLPVELE